MLNKLNINIDEIKANIDTIKSKVNKKKTYKAVGTKSINKHIQLDDNHIIDISINANTLIHEDGSEIIIGSKNIDTIIEEIAHTVVHNTTDEMIMPKSILISNEADIIDKLENIEINKDYDDIDLDILNIETPKYNINEIVLNNEMREILTKIILLSRNKSKIKDEFKIQSPFRSGEAIVCNFCGDTGSGKTCLIHSIASGLNKNIVTLNYSRLEILSINSIPKTIKAIFEIANRKNAVLVIEDSDSLIKENNLGLNNSKSDIRNIVKNCIKDGVKNFDSVLFFTSNIKNKISKEKIDNYFSRMFFIISEFKNPSEFEREKLWEFYIGQNIKLEPKLDNRVLAGKYQDVSRADIRDIVFIAVSIALENKRDVLKESDFDLAYIQVLKKA